MTTLYHSSLHSHSRFTRLILNELNVPYSMQEVRYWERDIEFLKMNPAGTVPVIEVAERQPICGLYAVIEYLDEAYGRQETQMPLMPEDIYNRSEVRRLISWFSHKFEGEVVQYLLGEKIHKLERDGEKAPEVPILRAGRLNLQNHLAYMNYLLKYRPWLAGEAISYADFMAAASISCLDYIGEIDWGVDDEVKGWYSRLKSRPAFRPILQDKLVHTPPSDVYTNLDF